MKIIRPLFVLALTALFVNACTSQPAATMNPSFGERPGGKVVAPKVLHKVDPIHLLPADLVRRTARWEVVVEAEIDAAGSISDPRIVTSSDPRVNEYVLKAVRQWRFRPGTLDGEPVPVLFSVTVTFPPRQR